MAGWIVSVSAQSNRRLTKVLIYNASNIQCNNLVLGDPYFFFSYAVTAVYITQTIGERERESRAHALLLCVCVCASLKLKRG